MSEGIQIVTMPKWGLSMKEGKVTGWLVDEGAAVASGAELVDIETEKISSAAEAPAGGVLRRRIAAEGDVLPVSGLLGIIADASVPDAEIDAFVADFQANFVPPEDDDEDSGPATESVEIDGASIRYLVKGEGAQNVLLIHGFGGDLNNWLFNHDALAETRTVYALDLPGHGGSAKAVADGSLAALAGAVHKFMDALGIEQAHLVGHSLGGAVALAFALGHAGRVASLTLICSAGLGPEINTEYIQGFIGAGRRKEIKPWLEQLFADPSLVSRQLVDDILKFKRLDGVEDALRTIADGFIADGTQSVVLADRLGEAGVPVLVVWGAEDRIIPPAHADGLPEGVTVEIIAGSGHMVQMEAAGAVNGLIEGFLNR